MEIALGQTVKDRITGFKGVVTGLVDYISGCRQALVSPTTKPDGDFAHSHWFDTDRLDVQDVAVVTLENRKRDGCDAPAPIR